MADLTLRPADHAPVPEKGALAVELVDRDTDAALVGVWLSAYEHASVHTQRSHQKEARRFLAWLEVVKGPDPEALPKVTGEDVNRYVAFLGNPRPLPQTLLWKYGMKQQPFRVALKRQSIRQAVVILSGLYEAGRNTRTSKGRPYIEINPWTLVKSLARSPSRGDGGYKALEEQEWQAVLKVIEDLPQEGKRDRAHYHRCRWVIQLLYRSFLRRDEAAGLLMGSFINTEKGWVIELVGKGDKAASIVVTKALLSELTVYRLSQGLSPLPSPGETTPAVMTLTGHKPVGAEMIYRVCKTIFMRAADAVRHQDERAAARLLKAAAHSLRHTGVTHSLDKGIDPRYVQAQARHSSLAVTAIYDHKEKKRWREAMENL